MEYQENTPKPLPKPNPITQDRHRRQVKREVIRPLIFGVLVVLLGVAALVYYQVGTIEAWSQVAVIFIILPALVLGLIVLALLVGFSIGIGYLLQYLPPYARLTQDAIDKVGQQIQTGAQVSMKPVIQIQKFIATIEKFFKRN